MKAPFTATAPDGSLADLRRERARMALAHNAATGKLRADLARMIGKISSSISAVIARGTQEGR